MEKSYLKFDNFGITFMQIPREITHAQFLAIFFRENLISIHIFFPSATK